MIKETANKLIEGFYGILPYETAKHVANAQKEFLLAIESVIDEQIKWTDVHVERAHGRSESAAEEPLKS
ncbi:MAG TPA: hypothetical protein VKY31_13305 [Terriglobia bacterium]|nr:hypothetical protein [Terriglobia bacterium]